VTEVFPIIPASAKPIWILGVVCVVLILIFAALAYTTCSTRSSQVEVGHNQLRLADDFWGRTIDIELLQLDNAAIVDLGSSNNYAPRRRTFGTAVPGYASGWFRLRNGDKALAYLTSRESVTYIPTTLGYSLLLSVDRPDQLLDALRSRQQQ
jgi:hypothetical protein